MHSQRGFALIGILIFILLLISIPVGLYLIKNPQILRSRASANPILFVNPDNSTCDSSLKECNTNNTNIKLQLTSSLGSPASQVTVSSDTAAKPITLDLSKLRTSYNSTSSQPNYNQDYDLNHDGKINSFDYVLIVQKMQQAGGSGNGQNTGTAFYKIAEDPTDLDLSTPAPYISEPTTVDFTFKDPNSFGKKFIWVEFISSNGIVDKRTAQINYTQNAQTLPTSVPSSASTNREVVPTPPLASPTVSSSPVSQNPSPTTTPSPSVSPAGSSSGLPYLW